MTEQEIRDAMRARLTAGVITSQPGEVTDADMERNVTMIMGEFVSLMRANLVVGSYRYGVNRDKRRKKYDNINSAMTRLWLYLKDGNQEHLVDAANLAAVEFRFPDCHPNPRWAPTDEHNYHTKEIK